MKRLLTALTALALAAFSEGCASDEHQSTITGSDGMTSSATVDTLDEHAKPALKSDTKTTDANTVASNRATVTLNGQSFVMELADNVTAKAFAGLLPLEREMSELNGNEKYVYLDEMLPCNPSNPGTIEAGDVMLYGSSCLVIFHESHPTSYSYTSIGKVLDVNRLAQAVGNASVSATFAAL